MADKILDILQAGFELKRTNRNYDMSSCYRKIEQAFIRETRAGNIVDTVWQNNLAIGLTKGFFRGANAIYQQNIKCRNPNVDLSRLERSDDVIKNVALQSTNGSNDSITQQRMFDMMTASFNFSKTRTAYTIDDDFLNSIDPYAYAELPTQAFMSTPSYAYMIRNTIGRFSGAIVCYLSDSPNDEPSKLMIIGHRVNHDHLLENMEGPEVQAMRFIVDLTEEGVSLSNIAPEDWDILMLVNAVLAICAKNISIEPSHSLSSSPKKIKSAGTLSYADRTSNIVLGVREGTALRENTQYVSAMTATGDDKKQRMAHMRRAHWHHYWTGSRSQPENRKSVLHWVAPTFISGVKSDVTVNHAVNR